MNCYVWQVTHSLALYCHPFLCILVLYLYLSFHHVHSGELTFTFPSNVFTPLLHMTKQFFAFHLITPPSARFVFVFLSFHLSRSPPVFFAPCMLIEQNTCDHMHSSSLSRQFLCRAGLTLIETVNICKVVVSKGRERRLLIQKRLWKYRVCIKDKCIKHQLL